jgi:hypothetical protein
MVKPNITYSAQLEDVSRESEKKFAEARSSQSRIDDIVAGTHDRLIKYRAMRKQAEGLTAYNEQLSTQIEGQKDLIRRFDKSLSEVALIERQMSPLVATMVEALAKFVELDLPFNISERFQRIAFIQDSLAAADVDVAEKFRQVIEAYQIETEYGRKIDSNQAIVELDGERREVDVLRVGRLTMVCQTNDTTLSGRWNTSTERWEVLDNITYRSAIRKGIKMAKKQASIDILTLPISAPVAIK